MRRPGMFHPVLWAGWTCLALACAPLGAQATDPAAMLARADEVKSANHDEFNTLLVQLQARSAQLDSAQKLRLRYLQAWHTAYFGNYAVAIPQLNAVIAEAKDANLRFRAGVTVVNVLQIASRYEEAFARLSQLLDLLPNVSDPEARQQGLIVAGQLYNQVGQYELSGTFADRLIRENFGGKGVCKGEQIRLEPAMHDPSRAPPDSEFRTGIDACTRIGEPIWTNFIRTYLAKVQIARGQFPAAIRLLTEHEAEVGATKYPRLMSAVDSALAQAYWRSGDAQQAQQYARLAVASAVPREYTEPLVGAYDILYRAALGDGDYQAALQFHEKYAAADKGYLNDAGARTLAYQMVRQQVQSRKMQVDALNKENQVLQLRQTVAAKNAEATRLTVLLLGTVLVFIALFAYRTKRLQLRFMQMARRDGLTGIANRQHFVETAEAALAQCRKGSQDACVIVIDMDHFKAINDSHGHATGDHVLKCAVAAVRGQLRSIDLFGRLGGEEFGILMPNCVAATARQVAERIRLAIADCSGNGTNGDADFPVNASFGIAASRTSDYALRELMIHADSALYRAKREGRNRVVVYDHTEPDGRIQPPGQMDRRRN